MAIPARPMSRSLLEKAPLCHNFSKSKIKTQVNRKSHLHSTTLRTSLAGISSSVQSTGDGPGNAHTASHDGVTQTRDQESGQEGGHVLGEVGMSTLGYVFASVHMLLRLVS
jgi:hypothetical protein